MQALLGDDPSLTPLTPLLLARTQGNPFFLEESVRTLVETGVGGRAKLYRLVQTLPTIQVPATVQAVLAARIDRLPPEAKRLLQTAAAIGHEVPLSLLQAIVNMPSESLHRSLAHAKTAEFLYETRLFPESEYTFKHASPTRWPMGVSSRSDDAGCMPASSRLLETLVGTGWLSKPSAWHIMPCGGRSGQGPGILPPAGGGEGSGAVGPTTMPRGT